MTKKPTSPSSTVENYLKELFTLQQEYDGRVPLGKLAEALGVTPGTATDMVKRLYASELVEYEPRGGAALTAEGERIALQILRRHRLTELFLVEIMGFDWGEVHEEAEVLEHTVSDRMLDRMDEMLGHPSSDPHGDPIPDASGNLPDRSLERLSHCALCGVEIIRIGDQNPDFLRFLDERGLTPGTHLEVEARDPLADLVTVRSRQGEAIQIGMTAASKIYVMAADR